MIYISVTEKIVCCQFVQRVLLVIMPAKYQPDYVYLRHVKTFRVHIFTAIQIMCSVIMWIIKTIKQTSIIFPLMVIIIIIVSSVSIVLRMQHKDTIRLSNTNTRKRNYTDLEIICH